MPIQNETTLPFCPSRRLDVWCLRRINDPRHGADGFLRAAGEAGQEMPLTDADLRAHCAKRGLRLADAVCQRAGGLKCPYRPCYDSLRRELSVPGRVVREFHRDAENQIAILEAFEKAGWPPRIENVFPRPMPWEVVRHRLSNAVSELNEKQKKIRFSVERGTQAVLWELTDEDPGRQPEAADPSFRS